MEKREACRKCYNEEDEIEWQYEENLSQSIHDGKDASGNSHELPANEKPTTKTAARRSSEENWKQVAA